jgi:hypothetical protein
MMADSYFRYDTRDFSDTRLIDGGIVLTREQVMKQYIDEIFLSLPQTEGVDVRAFGDSIYLMGDEDKTREVVSHVFLCDAYYPRWVYRNDGDYQQIRQVLKTQFGRDAGLERPIGKGGELMIYYGRKVQSNNF